MSGPPQGRNKDKSYLQSCKTAGGGGGGREGSWAKRSSKNWPSLPGLGTERPCSRVRPSGGPQGACPPPLTKPEGRIWEGGLLPALCSCAPRNGRVIPARHLHKRATDPGDDQGLPSPPPQSFGAEAAWYWPPSPSPQPSLPGASGGDTPWASGKAACGL